MYELLVVFIIRLGETLTTWGTDNPSEFCVIKPKKVAIDTIIDNQVSGTPIEVGGHQLATIWAVDLAFHLNQIHWRWDDRWVG